MGIFSSIAEAIFGHSKAAPAGTGSSAATGTSAKPGAPSASSPGSVASTGSAAAGAAKPMTTAEVEAMIAKLAAGQREQYDWRQSIVDLMKLLNLDSSLNARKQLAQELGYTGALDGSAEMNVWLPRQVMTKLAESGGKVPDSLKA
jgi:Domain of unknown function (DUF3597)